MAFGKYHMKNKCNLRHVPVLLLILCCWSVLAFAQSSRTAEQNLKVFDQLWGKINDKFFDPKFNGTDWNKAREIYRPQAAEAQSAATLEIILNKMVGELRTSHVWVKRETPKTQKEMVSPKERKYLNLHVGYGVIKVGNDWVVNDVAEGSGAQAAGIEKGWTVLRLNDEPFDPFRDYGVEAGDTIRLKVLDNESKERVVPLTLKYYIAKGIRQQRMLDGNVLYLRFSGFGFESEKWFAEQIAARSNARALIVDLRGNGGGFISVMKNCLNQLFASPLVVGKYTKRGESTEDIRISGKGAKAFQGKVVVLIDGNSQSSAELFAAAVQESGRGQVVGQNSAGFVLLGFLYGLPENFVVHIPVRDALTGRGARLEGKGVKPDVEVPLTIKEIRAGQDRILERAVEIIK